MGSRYRSFPFIKLAKNDRMYYFIRKKVLVFNTKVKKATLNEDKYIFSLFSNIAQSLALSHHFVTGSHTSGRKNRLSRSAEMKIQYKRNSDYLCKQDIS